MSNTHKDRKWKNMFSKKRQSKYKSKKSSSLIPEEWINPTKNIKRTKNIFENDNIQKYLPAMEMHNGMGMRHTQQPQMGMHNSTPMQNAYGMQPPMMNLQPLAELPIPPSTTPRTTLSDLQKSVNIGLQQIPQNPMPQAMSPMPQAMSPMPQAMSPMPQAMSPMPQAMSPMPQAMSPMPQAMSPMNSLYGGNEKKKTTYSDTSDGFYEGH